MQHVGMLIYGWINVFESGGGRKGVNFPPGLKIFFMKTCKKVNERWEQSGYLKMYNCRLDKSCIEMKVIKGLPFLYFQAILAK